ALARPHAADDAGRLRLPNGRRSARRADPALVAGREGVRLAAARAVASHVVKGVILAGGKGTRLHPLTRITYKHLLPIYDRPMVTYAVEALVGAGVRELLLVTGGT